MFFLSFNSKEKRVYRSFIVHIFWRYLLMSEQNRYVNEWVDDEEWLYTEWEKNKKFEETEWKNKKNRK
jgi:hypothetical protein